MRINISVLITVFLISGCGVKNSMEQQTVNFEQIKWYAQRASAAYQSEEAIKKAFPDTTRITTIKGTKVQYFIENPKNGKTQVVSIRGTNNLANVREDAEILQSNNQKLGIYVHKGFDEDANLIYHDLLPFLDKDKELIFTGHSLGAAVSTLLMMYLHEDGFKIGLSVNFGQPKVTNSIGAEKYAFLPLLRVVDENDVVPLLPPTSLISSSHGIYEHMGSEVILLEGVYYVYQDTHLQRQSSSDSFWKNLGNTSIDAHFIKHYLHNIASKLKSAEQIPFIEREKYIDN
jgi:predicted lipase